MITILTAWLIYSIGGLSTGVFAFSCDNTLTTRKLYHIMLLWPLVLVRHGVEAIKGKL